MVFCWWNPIVLLLEFTQIIPIVSLEISSLYHHWPCLNPMVLVNSAIHIRFLFNDWLEPPQNQQNLLLKHTKNTQEPQHVQNNRAMFAKITRESLKKLLYQKQHTPKKKQNTHILDGGFNPLKNSIQLGLLFPIYGKIKILFQTTNQFIYVDKPYSWINKP